MEIKYVEDKNNGLAENNAMVGCTGFEKMV
jgi:hypothetical protein